MKKLISIFLITLIFGQCTSMISYANCKIPSIKLKDIDFSETMDDNPWVTQTLADKTIMIARFEKAPNLKENLLDCIKNSFAKLIRVKNSKIEPAVIEYIGLSMVDLAIGRSGMESEATKKMLENAKSYITEENLKSLPENDKILAISDGKKSSAIATLADTALSLGGGGLVAAGLVKLGAAATAVGAVSTGGAALATMGTVLVLGSAIYNNYCIVPLENQASDTISLFQKLYKKVRDAVVNHEWIGKNVLLMTMSNEPGCSLVDYDFASVDGVKYKKSQAAMNWDFARAECQFLGEDHEDCQREAMKVIKCIWENINEPEACPRNPYFKSTNTDPTPLIGY